ncbi:MAG: hypothetical protein PVH22_06695, partial [Desulfobacteraceae bacterium]
MIKKISTISTIAIMSPPLFISTLYAGDSAVDDISWGFLLIGLLGGLSFFLYGMEKMSEGMKKSAGNQMR